MAASDKVFSVKLSEDDVPGAKFHCSDISEHSVCELKRWLECRGLNVSGQKTDLIERCKGCIDAGGADEIIISIDGGRWYEQKVNRVLAKVRGVASSSTEVPIFPTTGWKNFPAGDLPKGFCYGTIYEHIIASANITQIGQSDSESDSGITDFNTSKPMLKGRQYFTSGHVKNLKHQIKENFQFIKCSVMASYTIKTNYNICLTLASSTGKVMDAACDCKASSMGRCNHIAAVLFAVEDYIMKFGHQVAPTSKLCTWNTGRKSKRDPQPCHSADYNKKMKPDRIINFDPRSENIDDKMFVDSFIASLPKSSSNCMMQQVLEIKYSDYDVDKVTLKRMADQAINLFKSTCTEKRPFEVPGTQAQTNAQQWYASRSLRVTASISKEVVFTKTMRGKYQLLKRLLWGKTLPDMKALRYGKTHENDAFEAYCKDKEGDGLLRIVKSGMWINPKFVELGCSPDGLIYDSGNLVGVLEIKCPLVLEKYHPINTENLKKTQRHNLCYSVLDGEMVVKRTHAYYYQIQMQMAICEVDMCDFVIWSPKGMIIQRVMKDEQFWDDLCPKLIDFHHHTLMPEYLEMRIPRRLMPVEL